MGSLFSEVLHVVLARYSKTKHLGTFWFWGQIMLEKRDGSLAKADSGRKSCPAYYNSPFGIQLVALLCRATRAGLLRRQFS